MAHTKVTKTYSQNTGAANTFSYSGSFDVFKGTEVVALLNNVQLTFTASTINESASPREYTVDTSAKTIHIGGADLSSGTIIIRPETDMGAPTPRATYAPGSSVTAEDLNNNQTQLMRKAMEYDETKMSSTGDTMTGDLTMGEDQTIIFEGGTDDGYETTLTVADPTADRTITLPNVTGTVVTTGDTGSVATAMIADDAVDNDKLANSIVSAIAANTAKTTNQTHTGDVTGSTTLTIANDAVGADQLDSNAVVNDSVASAAAIEFTKLENLDSTKILVGNSSNKAAEVSMSGDVHISNTGATTIQANAVQIGNISDTETSLTTNSDVKIPTSKAVADHVKDVVDSVGGFKIVTAKGEFPTSHPDPKETAGMVLSIVDADGISIESSGTTTTGNCTRAGGSDAVVINGFPASVRGGGTNVNGTTNSDPHVLAGDLQLLVQTTTTAHTYDFYKFVASDADVLRVSDDIVSFQARYRVASSAPGSDNNDGDLYYNTSTDTLYVWDGSQWETSVATSPGPDSVGNAQIADNAIDSEHYTDGSIDHVHLAADAVDGDNIADDSINSEHYVDGSIDEAHIADNQVSLAKMAGIARGKIIYGDASGNPAVLAPGSSGQVLESDGTDIAWQNASAGATGGNSNANKIFWENEQTVTHAYTIQNNHNAGSFGPITINSGVTVTVGSGENWSVF